MGLVLTREKGDSIMIGDDIEIIITEVGKNGRVRLLIEAPDYVVVHRKEVYDRNKQEQKQKETLGSKIRNPRA